MSTDTPRYPEQSEALFGETRRAVLGVLFTTPNAPLHVREIIRRSGVGQGSVQRELARLHHAGLLVREEAGNQVLYRPNTEAPIFEELASLVAKTAPRELSAVVPAQTRDEVFARIREHLDEYRRDFSAKRIALFGSAVRDELRVDSDIDVLVDLGEHTYHNYMGLRFALIDVLGREVDLVMYEALHARMRDKVLAEAIDVA